MKQLTNMQKPQPSKTRTATITLKPVVIGGKAIFIGTNKGQILTMSATPQGFKLLVTAFDMKAKKGA